MSEELICVICEHDIRKLNCFPVYSRVHEGVICSQCCLLGAYYHQGILSEEQLNSIPEKFRKEIIKIYNEV